MKEAIQHWLDSKKKDYQEGLALLGPIIRNKYLFRHLSLKENIYNQAKLEHELKKAISGFIPKNQSEKKTSITTPANKEPAKIVQSDDDEIPADQDVVDINDMTAEQTAASVEKLEVALGKMHNKKGILANSLRNFDAKDNDGRKAVLEQINGIDEDMNIIRGKLDYHQKHGTLPPILTENKKKAKEIPEDPVKMKEMLLNLRSSRTKINKQLKDRKISSSEKEKLETRLQEKVSLITEIERRLNGG